MLESLVDRRGQRRETLTYTRQVSDDSPGTFFCEHMFGKSWGEACAAGAMRRTRDGGLQVL